MVTVKAYECQSGSKANIDEHQYRRCVGSTGNDSATRYLRAKASVTGGRRRAFRERLHPLSAVAQPAAMPFWNTNPFRP
jgi:hypothetical protein